MAQIVDGKAIRDQILSDLKQTIEIQKLTPRLSIVQVGENAASTRYISQKIKAGEEIGAQVTLYQVEKEITFPELKKLIAKLNRDKLVNGIIVQLPLPRHLNQDEVTALVNPGKDVDGLARESQFEPATPLGVMKILEEYKVEIKNKVAVVIGQSKLVGDPLSKMLEESGTRVIRIDINTPTPIDLLVQQADIVVAAVGKIGLVTESMVKSGAVVIDVGTNLEPETGRLVGDIDFENVKEKASLITPVPGGVGPLTVAMLLSNLVKAAKSQSKK